MATHTMIFLSMWCCSDFNWVFVMWWQPLNEAWLCDNYVQFIRVSTCGNLRSFPYLMYVCRVCDFRFTFSIHKIDFRRVAFDCFSMKSWWQHDFKLCLVSMIRQSACIFITTFNTATSVLVVSLSLCHSCILKSIYFSIDSWIDMCSNYTIIVRLISIAF